jgi:hypothetical protein
MTQADSARVDDALPTNSLFEERWWLDAVAPGAWREAVVRNGETVVARMPYVFRPTPVARIAMPPLTPWLGPAFALPDASSGKALGREHECLAGLIEQLPKADVIRIGAAPEQRNLLAFHWAGYDLAFAYTYRLDLALGEAALWAGLRDNIRREVRKGEKMLSVTEEHGADAIIRAVELTFGRQGMRSPQSGATLESIMRNVGPQNRTLLAARDRENRLHAAALYVHDHRHCFYLIGGADPELRTSGAQSVLMWEAIRRSIGRSAIFDFEGSMKQGIERFFRSFGATQTPRFFARKITTKGHLALQAQDALQWVRRLRTKG